MRLDLCTGVTNTNLMTSVPGIESVPTATAFEPNRPALLARFHEVRLHTERLAAPLTPDDQQAQSMPDASPVKWHLAHTTWFYETFVLEPLGVPSFEPAYRALFNSYYEAVSPPAPRAERGVLTRPSLEEVWKHRRIVDERVASALYGGLHREGSAALVLGTHHEEQHQELILTDLLHLFSRNPIAPRYAVIAPGASNAAQAGLDWVDFDGGLVTIGHRGRGFAFDNELPAHRVWLEPFALASRLVTNGELLEFVEAGGYRKPELWMSDGWAARCTEGWEHPLYWRQGADGGWRTFGLDGERELDSNAPAANLSWFEADAYARWRGCRLPREEEWEVAARFADARCKSGPALSQMRDVLWQWTASAYDPYPGFRPLAGALGEYNGKFMSGQRVLRGGSFATPRGHARNTYRNFFPPGARWQFTGIRLARDGS